MDWLHRLWKLWEVFLEKHPKKALWFLTVGISLIVGLMLSFLFF